MIATGTKIGRQLFLGVASALLLVISGVGAESLSVKRGPVERSGRGWAERFSCSAPVREGSRLVLRIDSGSVTVRAGEAERMECKVLLRAYSKNEVRAKRFFDEYELTVRPTENGGAYVSGKGGEECREGSSLSAEFEVTVPSRFNLDLETQGGDIVLQDPLQGDARMTTAGGELRTSDVSGTLRAETAGGNVTLGNIGQRLNASTAGGNIRVGNVKADASLETSGGEIAVDRVEGALRAETAGGDVTIGGAGGQVVAQTAGGQIRIGPARGNVRAETAGGSVWLQGASGRVDVESAGGSIDLFQVQGAIRASTASGPIMAQIFGDQKIFGASQLETAMGDVQVYLPPDLPLTIDAAIEMAAGHRIISDFPLEIRGDQEDPISGEIRGRGALNGGGETLRIRTVNGNIEIRKLDSRTLEQLKQRQESNWKRWESSRTDKDEQRREKDKDRDDETD